MINDTAFSANITEYRNYLYQPHIKYKGLVGILYEAKLLTLFVRHYENSGNFIYGINKYELEQRGNRNDKRQSVFSKNNNI